jgi:predicted nucleic acid-binding protein
LLVVDASVVVDAALDAEGFSALADEALVAPRLLWSEVPSALCELAWRRVVPRDRAAEALEHFLDGPVTARTPGRLPREAWRVAEELGWAKTYDAEYVALARLLGCRLMTADMRLRRGAARAVDVIGPAEL